MAPHTIVRTNHHDRFFVYRNEVPAKVLEDFDWLDDDTLDGFLCYHGIWHHLQEFLAVANPHHGFGDNPPDWLKPWDGYATDSMWTGTVIKVADDQETYRIGSFRHVD